MGKEGTGEKGVGGVWEVGKEGLGSRIPEVEKSRRNKGKLCNIDNILQSKKHKEVGARKGKVGAGFKGTGSKTLSHPNPH